MSRLLSYFLEYLNIIAAILIIMSIAAMVALVVSEPSGRDGLLLIALVGLIILMVANGLVAVLMTTRRHLTEIQADKLQQLEHLSTIFRMSGAAEIEAAKRQDMKYPPTNL